MFSVEPKPYGYKIVFSGMILHPEMVQWHRESINVLKTAKKGFNVLIDMSQMGPLFQDAKTELETGQTLYKRMGMNRSAVIVPSRMVAKQLRDMATASNILPNERYFSVEDIDAEAEALKWVSNS